MKIIVSDEADNDLLAIFSYLHRQSPQAAELIALEIKLCFENLSLFPLSGSSRPRLGPDIKSAVVPPYMVLYAVRTDHITVLRVLHGSRDIEREFNR
jgi:toxin ParE1/3/4